MTPEQIERLRQIAEYKAAPYMLTQDAAALRALLAEWEEAKNLLAVIHRDGGHHTADVGYIQSCQDARTAFLAQLQTAEERGREIERLRSLLVSAYESRDAWIKQCDRAEAKLREVVEEHSRLKMLANANAAGVDYEHNRAETMADALRVLALEENGTPWTRAVARRALAAAQPEEKIR